MYSGGSSLTLEAAVAVIDLHAAGIAVEMGDVPFVWDAAVAVIPAVAAPVIVATPVTEIAVTPRVPVEKPILLTPMAQEEPPLLPDVWHAGEPGGVVAVIAEGAALDGPARRLLDAMLAAAGKHDIPLGWVGAPAGAKTEAQAIANALKTLAPTCVLALGQDALAALTGTKIGVDGWYVRTKPRTLPAEVLEALAGAPVGATYPPALLLVQPLLKRLAWRHLLAWAKPQVTT